MKRLFRKIPKVIAVIFMLYILYTSVIFFEIKHEPQGGHAKFAFDYAKALLRDDNAAKAETDPGGTSDSKPSAYAENWTPQTVAVRSTQANIAETTTNHVSTTVVRETTPTTFPLEKIFECNLPPSDVQKNASRDHKLPICPCVPRDLRPFQINYADSDSAVPDEPYNISTPTFDRMHKLYSDVKGGHWNPKECVPRHKMVLIVPFRDREDHMQRFLDVIHRFLQKQKLDYTIIVAEQIAPFTFNKAKLMNAAYVEAKKLTHFDCVVFHDVDLLPEDERNLYTCPSDIRHQGLAINIYDYKMIYGPFIGGVSVFRPHLYEAVNGHSNGFWGWGGEDDNIYRRVRKHKVNFRRPPVDIARYYMFTHDRDSGNAKNPKRTTKMAPALTEFFRNKDGLNYVLVLHSNAKSFSFQARVYMYEKFDDGLSSLRYKLLGLRRKKLFTWMLFDLTDDTTTTASLPTSTVTSSGIGHNKTHRL